MCNNCKENATILVKCTPIEVNFTIKATKKGAIKRISDLSASQIYDPDKFVDYTYIALCQKCGAEVDLKELEIKNSCSLCISTEVMYCTYNGMYFCEKCAKSKLNYCRSCPFLNDCELGSKNVTF